MPLLRGLRVSSQQVRKPAAALVDDVLYFHVHLVPKFIDEGLKACEAFVKAGVETPSSGTNMLFIQSNV
jgi:hypothetical protein